MKLKKKFYRWAYLDIEDTENKRETYYARCAGEIASQNVKMIQSLAEIFTIISVIVIFLSLTFMDHAFYLALLYVSILVVQVIAILLTVYLFRHGMNVPYAKVFSVFYLAHILAIGSVIGTLYSPRETAVVFVVLLAISQILIIMPPLYSAIIAGGVLIVTLVLSYHIKRYDLFQSDVLNCVCVYALSILIGWRINRIRIEEAYARTKADSLNARLERISTTDELTELFNHRSFQEQYYNLYEKAKKEGKTIGIIMMDIDKFKAYNDNYGHVQGDACLNKVGRAIGRLQKENITAFRFGGEEFVILVEGELCKRMDEIAESFHFTVENLRIPHSYSKVADVITISLGYYVGKPNNEHMPMEFVDYADKALYLSKQNGRNQVNEWK